MSFVKTENGRGQCLTDDLKTMRAWYSSIARIADQSKRLLTSALVASMHQPVGLSIEVAYEIPYVKLKNTHCQQALRAKRPLTSALVA